MSTKFSLSILSALISSPAHQDEPWPPGKGMDALDALMRGDDGDDVNPQRYFFLLGKYFPRDPITLSEDDWDVQSPPQQGI